MRQDITNAHFGAAIVGIFFLAAAATAWSQEPTFKANVPETVLTPDKLQTELLGDLEFF